MKVDTMFLVSCLVILVHFCVATTSAKCSDKERLSLLSFKRGLRYEYPNPSALDYDHCISERGNEEEEPDCCRSGVPVFCDKQTGHVVELSLGGCSLLEGTISPSLAELHHLTRLDLRSLNFTPYQFPTFILSLKRLQFLSLQNTNLRGNIPLQLGYHLSQLQRLILSENQLEGGLPKSLALCSLTDLDLRNNSLSGKLDEFLALFNHCANISLRSLDLSHNRFTGSVPNLSRFSLLETLYLFNNQLNGTLHGGIGLLSKLTSLAIDRNFLHGVISETHFLTLSQLKYLDLSFNNLTFKISPGWVPPFQLDYIGLASCRLGPDFPNWLRNQQSCYNFDVSNAEISSTVPNWFWDLPNVDVVNLSHNQFFGEMQHFRVRKNFLNVDFSSNLFQGSIPSNLSQSVQILLNLSNNTFTDASGLLCPNMDVAIKFLDISDNQLSGVIPDCWEYFVQLVFLDVANNSLFGRIPKSMGSLITIQSLHIEFNKLYGDIPFSLHKCTKLVDFDVAGNNLSGLIPSWIGDELKNISVLILRSNKFFGSLPPNICSLPRLQILDLSMNNIYGSLPKCINHLSALASHTNSFATIRFDFDPDDTPYDHISLPVSIVDIATLIWKGKMSKYQSTLGLVKIIDLSSNMLIGEIPSELMDLVGLVSLNISRNMFSGQIPATIGQLKLLDFLDLSRNNLSGHIPSQLSQIDRLGVMDLSYNNLSGEIPHGTQLQSFDPSTYEGNSHLCGDPLPKCPTIPTLDHPHDENSEDDQFFSRGFFISLSMGCVTGFWGICSFIFLNKSFRYAYFTFVNDMYDQVYVVVAVNVAKLRRWKRVSS